MPWYCLKVKPRSEIKVNSFIQKRKIETFLPLVTTIKYYSDRKKKIFVPLINGYVFVNCEPEERKSAISMTPGAMHYLKFKGRYAEVKPIEIENIKIMLREPEKVKIEKDAIQKGNPVKIKSGVFSGLSGEIQEVRGNFKLLIRIEEISIAMSVEVKPTDIELQ